ncbi:MAG TPA: TonB-dependent receptor [Caulobacteraceae bacterium]|jgi:outer membrane receptor protein involved in Fe transport
MAAGTGFAQTQPATDQAPQTQPQTPAPSGQKTDDGNARKTDKGKKPEAPKTTAVSGVTITAEAPPVRTDIDRRSYDLSKDVTTQNGGSIADALRNIPSVAVDIDGAVTLRGQSGVAVMVDGKPSPLLSGPGSLLQIPADQFERVEVMTNPSAAFSPEGSAGIINLISKKHHPSGSTGSIRVSAADAERERASASGSVKTEKLTFSSSIYQSRNGWPRTGSGVTDAYDPATGQLLTSNASHSATAFQSSNFGGGATVMWAPDPKTQITFGLNATHGDGDFRVRSGFVLTDSTGAVQEDLMQTTSVRSNSLYDGANLTYRRDFTGDDHNLTIGLWYDRFDHVSDQRFTETLITPASPETFERTDQDGGLKALDFSGDYSRPMPGGAKLKAGWDVTTNDNDTLSSGFLNATSPTAPDDPSQTDRYYFRRTVSAAYLTYQQPIGKLTILGGLRVEGENLDINDATTSTEVRDNDVHLYPTLHLQYALDDRQTLSASYSERIERPQAAELDPFLRVLGTFYEYQGNPHLQPEQTKSYEAGWQYQAAGTSYLATLYYKSSTGGVTNVSTDLGNGVLLSTEENLTRSENAGLELVAAGNLPHGFSYNVSGNVYWNKIDGSVLGQTETRSDTTLSGRASINWQADPKDFLQVNVTANGRTLTPQGYTDTEPTVNFGYRRKLTDRLAFVGTVQDLFDTSGRKSVYDSPLLRGRGTTEQNDRAVFFGLTIALGAVPKSRAQPDFDYGSGGGDSH